MKRCDEAAYSRQLAVRVARLASLDELEDFATLGIAPVQTRRRREAHCLQMGKKGLHCRRPVSGRAPDCLSDSHDVRQTAGPLARAHPPTIRQAAITRIEAWTSRPAQSTR